MLRRVAWSVLLLTLVSFLTFVVFYVLPTSDPAILRAGRNATPELIEEVRTKLGLDKPVYEQFWIYGKGVVTDFDLGYSYYSEVPVREEIFSRLPASIAVALGAFVLWMAIALPVGILTALKPRSKTDRVVTGTTLFFLSAPTYWLGPRHALPLRERHRRFKLIGGAGTYVPFSDDPTCVVRVALLALDRARARVRGVLRADDRREPPRRDGAGLRADRACEGDRASGASCSATACAPR